MIARLQALLGKLDNDSDNKTSLSTSELQLASAALLVEVATIDQQFDATELDALGQQLQQQFSLTEDELHSLTQQATQASKQSSSLYEFTQLINRYCDDEEKYTLACGLWAVAYADGNLDKYEEHIIRRICDLIHLRHSDFIRAKHESRPE